MGIIGGRKRRDDDDGISRGLLNAATDPESCKALHGRWDRKSGRCHLQFEKNKEKPKEIKVIEFDEYLTAGEEGGMKSSDES